MIFKIRTQDEHHARRAHMPTGLQQELQKDHQAKSRAAQQGSGGKP